MHARPWMHHGSNMVSRIRDAGLQLFTTCPPSYDATAATYLRRVADAARWSEDAGCEGMLIYTDNRTVDPWLVAQTIISRTKQLSPLVAVQPVYLHPFALAKLISSLGLLHQRRVYLNLVAGGFLSDLAALHDQVSHDERYARLVEYTQLTLRLLESAPPYPSRGSSIVLRIFNSLRPSTPPSSLGCSSLDRRMRGSPRQGSWAQWLSSIPNPSRSIEPPHQPMSRRPGSALASSLARTGETRGRRHTPAFPRTGRGRSHTSSP